MRKYKLLSIATFTAFSLWASPAMAQVSEGDDFDSFDSFGPPPAERGFYEANEYGKGCSRRRPKECTPEQRDEMNRLITLMCNLGGVAVGGASTAFMAVAAAPVLSPVGSTIAAGIYGSAVGLLTAEACAERNKIPAPKPPKR
ncbi:MAG: hypothetical protein ACK519_10245 [Sphingomonadaceae bacterium]|jgi:hypothetical protein